MIALVLYSKFFKFPPKFEHYHNEKSFFSLFIIYIFIKIKILLKEDLKIEVKISNFELLLFINIRKIEALNFYSEK